MKRLVVCVSIALLCSVAVQAMTTKAGGTLATDEVWTVAGGPYTVTGSIIIPAGRTLTVEPGVNVYLGSGVSIIAADSGRILAEGTETQGIRFTSPAGSSTSWGGASRSRAPSTRRRRIWFTCRSRATARPVSKCPPAPCIWTMPPSA